MPLGDQGVHPVYCRVVLPESKHSPVQFRPNAAIQESAHATYSASKHAAFPTSNHGTLLARDHMAGPSSDHAAFPHSEYAPHPWLIMWAPQEAFGWHILLLHHPQPAILLRNRPATKTLQVNNNIIFLLLMLLFPCTHDNSPKHTLIYAP
jgi:hypothetical protein